MISKSKYHLVAVSPLSTVPTSPTRNEVLSVLGGKASCRRKFVLYVQLLDEKGKEVSADMTLTASLAYAHDNSPVKFEEGEMLVEPPLFSTFNGVEFPANRRPTQMVAGRATFKLAISLLSSKCDNRMFTVCFQATTHINTSEEGEKGALVTLPVPPGPCFSNPIRSISRKRSRGGGSEAKSGRTPTMPTPDANLFASRARDGVDGCESAVVKLETRTGDESRTHSSSLLLNRVHVPSIPRNNTQELQKVEAEPTKKLSRPGAPFCLHTLQINGPSRLNPKTELMHPQVAPPMPQSFPSLPPTHIHRLSDTCHPRQAGLSESYCAPDLFAQYTTPSGPLSPLSACLPGPLCMSPTTQAFFAAYHTAPPPSLPPVAMSPPQVAPRMPPGDNTPESGVTNSGSPESLGERRNQESTRNESLHPVPEEQIRYKSISGEGGGRGGYESMIQTYGVMQNSCTGMGTPSSCDIFQDVIGADMQFSGPFGDLSCSYSPFSEFSSPRHVMISPRTGGAFAPFSPLSGQFSPVCRILPYYAKCQTPRGVVDNPQSCPRGHA